jgi:hypothetical protein
MLNTIDPLTNNLTSHKNTIETNNPYSSYCVTDKDIFDDIWLIESSNCFNNFIPCSIDTDVDMCPLIHVRNDL